MNSTTKVTVRKEPNPRQGKAYPRWVAQWRVKGKVRTVYLGSCAKMSETEALEKATSLKALDLGIGVAEIPVTGVTPSVTPSSEASVTPIEIPVISSSDDIFQKSCDFVRYVRKTILGDTGAVCISCTSHDFICINCANIVSVDVAPCISICPVCRVDKGNLVNLDTLKLIN